MSDCSTRQLRLPAALLIALLYLLCPDRVAAQTGRPTDLPAAPATTVGAAGLVVFQNTTSAPLELEVRMAGAQGCGDGLPYGVRTLEPGRSWTITADAPVCWRWTTPAATEAAASGVKEHPRSTGSGADSGESSVGSDGPTPVTWQQQSPVANERISITP